MKFGDDPLLIYQIGVCHFGYKIHDLRILLKIQPNNDQCSSSYRNQSIDLQSKLIDWFLYDREHCSLIG